MTSEAPREPEDRVPSKEETLANLEEFEQLLERAQDTLDDVSQHEIDRQIRHIRAELLELSETLRRLRIDLYLVLERLR